MVMYALGVIPLIKECHLKLKGDETYQGWLADDSQVVGKIETIRKWWDTILVSGPKYGYFPNPSKSYLVVKSQHMDKATRIFKGTGVMIQSYAQRDLGAVIGNLSAVREKLREKVKEWVNQVEALARIAATQPHAAYSAFTLGLRHRWTYLQRTMAPLANLLQPLENAIRYQFIPALLGETKHYVISDLQRELFALPARLGGLAIDNPTIQAQHKYQESVELSQSLRALIKPPTIEGPPLNDQGRDQQGSGSDDESQNSNNPEDSKVEDTKLPIPNNPIDGTDPDENKKSELSRDEEDPDKSQDDKILAK